MPRGPATYWEIYDAQLSHIGRGVALWHPGPYKGHDGQVTPIRLADVGYMFQGQFVTLFNASDGRNPSAPNPCDPYPESKLLDALPCWSSSENFTSKSVKATVVDLNVANSEPTNAQVSAKLICEKEAGAALLLPGRKRPKFHSLNLKHKPDYREYCFQHCEEWLKASDSAAKDIELKDLIFVTGIDNVYAWSLFSFQRQSRSCAFKLTAGLSTVSGALDIQDSSIEHAPMTNFGPEDRPQNEELSAPDQTVFVRRFKMHRRRDKVNRLMWRVGNYMKHGGNGSGSSSRMEPSGSPARIVTTSASGSRETARPLVSVGRGLISPKSPTDQDSRTDIHTIRIITRPRSGLFLGLSHQSPFTPNTPTSPTRTEEPVSHLAVPSTSPMDHVGSEGSDTGASVVEEAEIAERDAQEPTQKDEKKRIRPRDWGNLLGDDRGGPRPRRGGGPGGAGGGAGSNTGGGAGGAGAGTGQGGGGQAPSSRLPGNSRYDYQGPGGGGWQARGYSSTGKERMENESDGSDNLNEDTSNVEESDEYLDESGSDVLDTEPLDPLDALLEYMLEVCPDAKYSCAGDDDLLQFKDYLSADWLAFPALLRKLKPEIALGPDGLAVFVKVPRPATRMEEQEELENEAAGIAPSFSPTESTKVDSNVTTPSKSVTPSQGSFRQPNDGFHVDNDRFSALPDLSEGAPGGTHPSTQITDAAPRNPVSMGMMPPTPRACTSCRARKIKCTGVTPCASCERRGIPCIPSPVRRARRVTTTSSIDSRTSRFDSGSCPTRPASPSRVRQARPVIRTSSIDSETSRFDAGSFPTRPASPNEA